MTAATRPPFVRLLAFARPLRAELLVAAAAGAGATAAGIALLGVSGYLIARAAEHPSVTALTIAVVAVRALGVSRGVLRYVERLTSHDAAFRVLGDLRVGLYRRLARIAPHGLRGFRSGDLLARLVSDVDDIQDVIVRGVLPVAAAALCGGVTVTACAFLLTPAAALLGAGLLVAGAVVPWTLGRLARASARRATAARGDLAARMVDVFSGARELIAHGAEDRALAELARADAEVVRAERRNARAAAIGAGLAVGVAGLTVWGVLVLGVSAVSDGTLGRVPLAALTLTALAAFETVSPLPAAAVRLAETTSSARRLTAVLDAPDPVHTPATPPPLPETPIHVRVRDLWVRYGPQEPWAVQGLDLDLSPGRRVALVGPSGAGKSTVAAVLLRFLDPARGTVTINGRDMTAFAPDDVRRVIGGMPQNPYVFDSTIQENLRLARPGASDEALRSAARRARLLDWIEALPQGWNTPVGTHGAALSGGERRRLALARALLADPPVMVLDEPTAHLDPGARAALTADLLDATRGRTTLLITHDLTGLDEVDEIIVLDHGRPVQRGSHQDLAHRPGPYARLTAWATA
ncbi:thiol reductant ABC exporter subunit CydC [Actinomadura fibrosa]|uniref:Thiol reductant ABC exporter subunit CydC n=1 Tax=Actinomadura fibrosa TaxID=111802 RepID=A0ABW2XRG2_9ACTN|nr:thiol reductant ABC exporter subunit CydC [Actinomadura fibrosa]